MRAHRVAWEIHNKRPVPEDLFVLHSCDIKNCVNPHHLRLGTAKDNAADAVARGQMPTGEKAWAAKLTDEQVRDIRSRKLGYGDFKKLGKELNMCPAYLSRVYTRKERRDI